MAEGAMTDVVDKCRDTKKLLNIVRRRDLFDGLFEKRIEMLRKAACHMHRAD